MGKRLYKKIIICPSSKINFEDNTNNGLLFRNLFKFWPKDKVGQVFNGGDNGDKGYFNKYYKLTANDRRFGKLYSKFQKDNSNKKSNKITYSRSNSIYYLFLSYLKKTFIETGIYELFFTPQLSFELKQWLDEFEPDLILVQGYSIFNVQMPLLIKKYTKARLVFFTTDDWPKFLYSNKKNVIFNLLTFLPRFQLNKVVSKMMSELEIAIAFGVLMQEEYTKRYSKPFHSIIHSDDYSRFKNVNPLRKYNNNTLSIVTIGVFNEFRWPLLADLELACELLNNEGINAKVTVASDVIDFEGINLINDMNHVSLIPDPGSSEIIKLLKGADILLLIEGFDDNYAESIFYSISTKSHLYMFSGRPILVYSHKNTGVANYANKLGWAVVVSERNITILAKILKEIYLNNNLQEFLIQKAYKVAIENHDNLKTVDKFYKILHTI
jgi:hypothetical protein